MITGIATTTIFVHDQDRAKQFYTEKLGFEVRMDLPLWPGAANRWIAVAPAGAKTELVLMGMDEHSQHYKTTMGKDQALTFSVSEIAATCSDLKSKGVEIVQEPKTEFWGTYAIIRDSEGNGLMLVQS